VRAAGCPGTRPASRQSAPQPLSALAARWPWPGADDLRGMSQAGVMVSAWLCSGPDSSDTGAAVLALVIYEGAFNCPRTPPQYHGHGTQSVLVSLLSPVPQGCMRTALARGRPLDDAARTACMCPPKCSRLQGALWDRPRAVSRLHDSLAGRLCRARSFAPPHHASSHRRRLTTTAPPPHACCHPVRPARCAALVLTDDSRSTSTCTRAPPHARIAASSLINIAHSQGNAGTS
jgi:hypothetical protein